MSYRYIVSYATSSSGPWTQASTVTTQNYTITGLASGTNYWVQLVAVDTITGLQSAPVVAGPYQTSGIQSIQESPEGATVTSPSQTIYASQSVGNAAPPNGPFDTWTITGAGGQVVRNGTTDTRTASIIELYYHNHTVYQEAGNANNLGLNPGWWAWNGSGWTDSQSPVPVTPQITGISLSNTALTAASGTAPAGTTVGAITVSMNSGTFSGSLSLPSQYTNNFQISGSNLLTAQALSAAGSPYPVAITATQSTASNSPYTSPPFSISVGAAAGTGPGATSNFVAADFTATTGKTIYPQLFGAASGGLENNNFSDCSNTTLQGLVKALNLPLLRLHSQWGGTNPSVLANFVSNATKLVPNNCQMIVGISLGVTQAQAKAVSDYWVANSPIACNYWEAGNEPNLNGYSESSYVTAFGPISAGVRQTNPAFKAGGMIWAGDAGSGTWSSFIGSQNASSLGFLDFHDYLYCYGSDDQVPSPSQKCQAIMQNGTDRYVNDINSVNSAASGTYASNYPVLIGEYNIECGASPNDLSAGTCVGAAFLCTALFKMATHSNGPMWGAMWDLYNDGGANYNLIDTSMNVYPQYYVLQRLIAKAPGSLVSLPTIANGLLAWATVSGTNYCVVMVNTTGSAMSGPVALSHWPVNTTGTGTAQYWSYPTTSTTNPVANTPGNTSQVAVTNGVSASITVPAYSVGILSS